MRRHRRPSDFGMAWLTSRPALRAALFRTVDVAPACDSPAELTDHLTAYLGRDLPFPRDLTGRVTQRGVRFMADRFIVADTVQEATPALAALWDAGIASSLDLLGEATVTRAEGAVYARRCLEALDVLASATPSWPARPVLEEDFAGSLPRAQLSVKVTALTPLVRPQAPERGAADAGPHLRALLRRARDTGAHLHIDTESLDSYETVLGVTLDLLSEPEFADGPSAGVVLQAYLRESHDMLDRLLAWNSSARRTSPLTIRLVKGAYWDHEEIAAAQHGWPIPVWSNQAETNRCFDQLARRLIAAQPEIRLAIASHNVASITTALKLAPRRQDIEFQMLRGLGDGLARSLAAEGLRCRVYSPVGDMVSGMAYLVRRLLENSANTGFVSGR